MIYLARHGQDEDNAAGILNGRRDMPLTAIGLDQANQLAQKIKDARLSFDKIYSSPLQRAYLTAETIAEALKLPAPEKLDELIERDFGVMSGKPTNDIEALCSPNILKTDTVTYFLSPDGAETFPQLIIRAKKLLQEITIKHPKEKVLLVTHGDFWKMLYAAYYDLNREEVLRMFHFGNSELLLLSPDSLPKDTHIFNIEQHNH